MDQTAAVDQLTEPLRLLLSTFEVRTPTDLAKTDDELVHETCGAALCDVEHGDTLSTLVATALEHTCDTTGHTLTVHIENSYACGRETESTEQVRYPNPGEELEDWWDKEVQPLTGDGHSCGSSEHALYQATVTAAPLAPKLVGQTWDAEG